MYEKIKKRSGSVVKFDFERIVKAITSAGEATGEFKEARARQLATRAVNLAHQTIDKKIPSVEDIQDVVEDVLLTSSFKNTAKAYIIYRDQHKKMREIAETADVALMDDYLEQLDWQVNENSNMVYSLQGLNNYVASEISKVYWLYKIYPPEIKKAHLDGDFHIHDLSILAVYCVGWDLADLLKSGFKGVKGKIESRPAKHFRTALGQVVNFLYTLQGESAGAQAFSSFDTLLAPFIRYDKLSYKEVKQALQEFLYNMNVSTRVGFQTPFTNVTIDLVVPKNLADQHVIIGGEHQKEVYGDFGEEMNTFNKAFLELMIEGDAGGRVFSFPIPTYNITKDFDWDDPALEGLWEMTAKYGIPYFSNFINSDLSPDDARSMCCRLRLETSKLVKRGGGLFGAHPLTGSIGVVTINMPRIGFQANDEKEFLEILSGRMDLAKESLEIKRKILESFTDKDLYPYTKYYLRQMKERFGQYWKNHFSTIGLVGMNEACLNLFGKDLGSVEGKAFSEKVLDFMRDQLLEYQAETENNYNLEATPAEGTSYRLAKIDKKMNKKIVCANEEAYKKGAEPFYTNSTQLPVNYTDDMFESLDLQDSLQVKYTGGTVVHLFLGERINNVKVVKNLVRKICENYSLPYFTLTPTFSVCANHGYLSGEHFECPDCGETCEVYSRVVGYLRPVSQWNFGKKEEFKMRQTFKINKIKQEK